MVMEVIFWLVTLIIVIRFNKDTQGYISKRQWKFTNEIDGKEYTIEEMHYGVSVIPLPMG